MNQTARMIMKCAPLRWATDYPLKIPGVRKESLHLPHAEVKLHFQCSICDWKTHVRHTDLASCNCELVKHLNPFTNSYYPNAISLQNTTTDIEMCSTNLPTELIQIILRHTSRILLSLVFEKHLK